MRCSAASRPSAADARCALVNSLPGAQVLEVGVGTGLALPRYRRQKRITGIDLSAEMLARARERAAALRLSNVTALREMDAEAMDFPDGAFDVAVAMFVASVVPHPRRLVHDRGAHRDARRPARRAAGERRAQGAQRGSEAMTSPDIAIEVEGLSKSFDGREVVHDLSMQVKRGSIYGFLGPNGSGKTTTIRMLCGLLTPDKGRGTCLGYDIRTETDKIKLQVGYMTQRFSLYQDPLGARESRNSSRGSTTSPIRSARRAQWWSGSG